MEFDDQTHSAEATMMTHTPRLPGNLGFEPAVGDAPTLLLQNTPTESAAQPRSVQNSTKVGSIGERSREGIQERAQQLINDVNLKRKSDQALILDFKKHLEEKVTESCKAVELHMYQCYERNQTIMHEKLQKLFETLERIHKIEQEMEQFKQALGVFYNDIHRE